PSFLNFSQTIWDQICRRKSPSSLPSVANNLALEYSSVSLLSPLSDLELKLCLFLSSKIVNTNNEDTFVHETLHDLLKEIFRDSTFELICESLVSKNRRSNSSDKENYRGEKPDFKVVTNTKEEILFGEVKTKDSRSLLINKDLIKLSNFQSGALDELIKKYSNKIGLASFGPRIRIYEMDLNYDGMYRMFLMANVVTPIERAQFLSLIPVLEALYNIKNRISEVLEVIVSDTPASSPRSTYIRMPTPPPKLVKIAIEPSPTKDISPLIKSHSDEEKGNHMTEISTTAHRQNHTTEIVSTLPETE
ncbi:4044_t:CDS:2, partial [Racocetra persica]